jgi:hypothetical protein
MMHHEDPSSPGDECETHIPENCPILQ